MLNSKLSEHKFKKGKFSTSFSRLINEHGTDLSWFKDRLPIYLWLGLIIDFYGHIEGLEICRKILEKLVFINNDITAPSFSEVLELTNSEQEIFFNYCLENIEQEVLSPLTIIYPYTTSKTFVNKFLIKNDSIENRVNSIIQILEKCSDHQSNLSTDIRFMAIYLEILTHKFHVHKDSPLMMALIEYPCIEHANDKMRLFRGSIRSTEISMRVMGKDYSNEIRIFWEKVSLMTDCQLFMIEYEAEKENKHSYTEQLYETIGYFGALVSDVSPLDNKLLVLVGMSTYVYKRINEIAINNLENSIIARGTVRVLIENYIMMKYLLKLEKDKPQNDIWEEFQYYGIGQYKLIYERYNEFYSSLELNKSHVEYSYIDLLVNEYKNKEFIDMDTSYFGNISIRDKAIAVNEKALFDLYYDYDSAFEHGLWGAIRESSLLKCNNPAHQFHLAPDFNLQQNMKSVWHDCVKLMNKTLVLLKELFGLPDGVLEELLKYEK